MAIGRKLVRTSKPLESQAVLTLFLERGGNENVNLDQTTRLLGLSLLFSEGPALVDRSSSGLLPGELIAFPTFIAQTN